LKNYNVLPSFIVMSAPFNSVVITMDNVSTEALI